MIGELTQYIKFACCRMRDGFGRTGRGDGTAWRRRGSVSTVSTGRSDGSSDTYNGNSCGKYFCGKEITYMLGAEYTRSFACVFTLFFWGGG